MSPFGPENSGNDIEVDGIRVWVDPLLAATLGEIASVSKPNETHPTGAAAQPEVDGLGAEEEVNPASIFCFVARKAGQAASIAA